MSSEDADRLREAYDAYNRDGVDGILPYLDAEVEWRNPPESADAHLFVGHAGVREWHRMVPFESMRFEPERIEELADGRLLVAARFRFRDAAGERDMELPIAHLVEIRDGKATAFTIFASEAAAREAAGLSE